MTTATLWLAAGALWSGTLLPGSWWWALVGLALAGLAAIWGRAGVLLLLTGLVLLGSGLAGGRLALHQESVLAQVAQAGGSVEISGTVVSEPRQTPYGVWLVVRTSRVDADRSRQRVLLRTDADTAPSFGERLTFTATARPLGIEGFEAYLRQLGVAVEVTPVSPVLTAPPGWFVAATNDVRARVRDAVARALPPDAAGLLLGLVLGDTSLLSDGASDALTAAGLSHLVAVSGANVALVVGGVGGICALVQFGAKGRRRLTVVAVAAFVVLVRAEPSVLRAAVMALIVIAAQATGRGRDARHALGAAVVVLLLADPLLGPQLGFALSVLATAGVLIGGPWVAARIPGPRPLALLLGTTVGAQLGVAPVLVLVEGGVPLAAVPANLLAVPAAAAASAVGVITAVLAQASTQAGAAVAVLARMPVEVVLWCGRTFADGPQLTAASLLTPVAGLLVGALLLRGRAPRLSYAALALAVVVGVVPVVTPAGDVAALTVTALDVGQGDAILVEAPGPAGSVRMLVDGGPDPSSALRALRRRGVRRLDIAVVSHPHADHTDGLLAVLSRMPVGALVTGPEAPDDLDDPAPSASALLAVAGDRRVPVIPVAAGQHFPFGTAMVDVLSPPADGSLGDEPNENSLVLRVVDPTGVVLLTGDAEDGAQERLLARPDLLRADILKVPHHGGDTNAEGFFDAVGATTALIGVGDDNDYGHPHPDVLADLAGIRILRTDTGGTVSVAGN